MLRDEAADGRAGGLVILGGPLLPAARAVAREKMCMERFELGMAFEVVAVVPPERRQGFFKLYKRLIEDLA